MSMTMEDDIKRWTAKRKAALVMEIIQGKTTISEASRAFDISPSEIEEWVRRLTKSSNKMKIGASVLLGDEDEEVEVHGEPDCGDIGRGRRWVACG